MVLLWFSIVLGLVLTMTKLSRGITYNLAAGTNKTFSCKSQMFTEDIMFPAIKLFLDDNYLDVSCHLLDKNMADTEDNRKKLLVLYTSAGLAPTIEIFNSSYSKVFFFKMAMLENQNTWTLQVPRKDIAHKTDIAPTEQWYVKFNMHHGFNMFTTEGTLLDTKREPIFQWGFCDMESIVEILGEVRDVTITKSPCASDVALIGLICDESFNGIYVGLTISGFTTRDTSWCNLTESICAILDHDCVDLSLLNIVLTNTHLVVLTSLGLFISEDLRYGDYQDLKFRKPNFCGFERDDYLTAKIWYGVQCLANKENYEVDYISLTFNKDKTLSQESTCFFSNEPFREWQSCLPRRKSERSFSRRAVAFLVDYQQNTGVGFLTQQDRALISVSKLSRHQLNKKRKFPLFWFPGTEFETFGMFFYPNSHFLYVYGNQVWFSEDGGNKFELLINLVDETVVKTDTCVYTQGIIFVTDKGRVFYTKAGLHRYAKLATVTVPIFNIYFDHLGDLYCISLNDTSSDSLELTPMDVNSLLQEDDLGFDGVLSPQYITEEQIMFFCQSPLGSGDINTQGKFYNLYIGKVLEYGMGGSGIISKVFEYNYSPQFSSSVLVDILDRFPVETSASSPCVLNSLQVLEPDPDSTAFKLVLLHQDTGNFLPSDVGKTIVIPGYSSLLITSVTGDLAALADATMPLLAPINDLFLSKHWFLYDFGTTNGRKWRIVVDRCRYTIQQLNDLPVNAIKYLDLGSKLDFSFKVSPINVAFQIFQLPLMEVIVGNPNLLDVHTEDYWDDTDAYIMNLHVQSRFFNEGKTSVSVIVTQASLVCDVTTLILTLKNSCSYLKVMHYTLPTELPASDWLSPFPNASKLLKILPVNYRPPSRLGISVPLTNNFYNADPSKPKMRDYFPESKSSGIYKQCANKTKRSSCDCTNDRKLSFMVAFSDCKEKALRMKYPILKMPLHFVVKSEASSVELTSPYFVTITEVNDRTNWEISGTNKTSSLIKMRRYLAHKLNTTLYNPDGFTLTVFAPASGRHASSVAAEGMLPGVAVAILPGSLSVPGSELFHFRVAVIPGLSFCSLSDEFQLYVDDAPLAFPGQYLISAITAVLIGGVIFMTFVLEAYEIQVFTALKKKLQRSSTVKSMVSLVTSSTVSIVNEKNQS